MDFSNFLKNKRELLKALKEKEIYYFKEIVACHLKSGDNFVKDFGETIDKLLGFEDLSDINDKMNALETWDTFQNQKDQFYKYILDDSFDKEMHVIKDNEDVISNELTNIEKLCRVVLFTIIQDYLNKTGHIHEDVEPYFRLLWNYLLEPLDDEGDVKRIMTFDRDLGGMLLYRKLVFDKRSWLWNKLKDERKKNNNVLFIQLDALDEPNRQVIYDEIEKAYNTGKEIDTVLSSLYYIYTDILFYVLEKCVLKQFEVWLLHDVTKSLINDDHKKSLLSTNEMKLILACLSHDNDWKERKWIKFKQEGQKSDDSREMMIYANPIILGWDASNISLHMNNVNENIQRLNLILKKYIKEQIGEECVLTNDFYNLFLIKVYDRKVDNEDSIQTLATAFMEFANFPSYAGYEVVVRDVILERTGMDQLKEYNDQRKKSKLKDRINAYFYQDARKGENVPDENTNCKVFKCIRELPGLNEKAMEVFQ